MHFAIKFFLFLGIIGVVIVQFSNQYAKNIVNNHEMTDVGAGENEQDIHFSKDSSIDSLESVRRFLRVKGSKNSVFFEKENRSRLDGIHVLPIPTKPEDFVIDAAWADIEMPTKSYFSGFQPPNDINKWKIAQLQASRGEQILLEKLMKAVRSPFDLMQTDIHFKWLHRFVEHQQSEQGMLNEMVNFRTGHRAPVTLLGHYTFERENAEGQMSKLFGLNPSNIIKKKDFNVPKKIVAIGLFNENWGWLSTYFLNRTVHWGRVFDGEENPYKQEYKPPIEQIQSFLDNPNIVMMVVNGHHNCSHPKVISLPLGIAANPKDFWVNMQKAVRKGLKKEYLLYSAGSDYAFRPAIRDCVAKNVGADFTCPKSKISPEAFRNSLFQSAMILAMPGLGYDTYRLWETLYSGAVPVLERGFGMDRTLHKLPALLVDDFADLTPKLLRQAYLEILYRADEWEYERITKQYWERLLYEVADSASLEPMLKRHPMSAEEADFTRPLVPYDCEKMGGCGLGTKRTPKKSCAIDPSVMNANYKWV